MIPRTINCVRISGNAGVSATSANVFRIHPFVEVHLPGLACVMPPSHQPFRRSHSILR